MIEVADSSESPTPAQVDANGEEIATFAARINIARYAMLTRLRAFDAHGGWGRAGAVSCAHWLSWRINMKLTAAHEHVRVARALGNLPLIDGAFGRGELSYWKVRALTRAVTPETEQDFLNVALHGTADRMIKIEIQLPAEEAAVLWNALMSAMDGGASERESSAETSAAPVVTKVANDGPELEEQRADAVVDMARGCLQHRPRTLGSAYELVVITTPEQLEHGSHGVGGYLPVVFMNHSGLVIPSCGPSVATGRELEELERYPEDVDLHVDADIQRVWDGTRVRVAEMLDWMLSSELTRERYLSG